MAIDIYHSRRRTHIRCCWYKRDMKVDEETLTYLSKPNGYFYAEEVSPNNENNNTLSNGFMMSENSLTIFTVDNVNGLGVNDVVVMNDKKWIVVGLQRKVHSKRQWFSKNNDYITYISLRTNEYAN